MANGGMLIYFLVVPTLRRSNDPQVQRDATVARSVQFAATGRS